MRDLPPLRLVRQEDPWGCMLASLAMLVGETYGEVKAALGPWLCEPGGQGGGGVGMSEADGYLVERGYAVARRMQHAHVATCDREAWPPVPWAERHLCDVVIRGAGISHAVVMRADGSVLDPILGEIPSLGGYARVFWVAAVHRVHEGDLPQAVRRHGPGRVVPRVCQCKATWAAAEDAA